jgi:hypothetical protein
LRRSTQECQLAQRTANFILFALELIKFVSRIQCNHRGLANTPGDTAFFDGQFGQENRGIEGAGFIERFDRSANRITEFLLAEILFLAEADQQTRSLKVPGTFCSSRVVPALPSMSPRRTISEI